MALSASLLSQSTEPFADSDDYEGDSSLRNLVGQIPDDQLNAMEEDSSATSLSSSLLPSGTKRNLDARSPDNSPGMFSFYLQSDHTFSDIRAEVAKKKRSAIVHCSFSPTPPAHTTPRRAPPAGARKVPETHPTTMSKST